MKIQDRILRRNIGALELLAGAFPLELVFGATSRAMLLLTLAVGFYFARKELKREFSLHDVFALFTDSKPKEPSK